MNKGITLSENEMKTERKNVISLGESCRNFDKLEKRVIRCLNCFHHCILNPGPPKNFDEEISDPQACVGICGILHNWKGTLKLLDHSYPVVQCFDLIEKIPLFHFFPSLKCLFLGTSGCNMRCSFCQAWEISQLPKIKAKRKRKDGYLYDIEDSFRHDSEKLTPEQAVEKAILNECGGIVMSLYNEPTICFDTYLLEICQLAKSKGLKVILVSNGYQSIESINLVAKFVDAISVGLKACTNHFYSSLCGARLEPILRNIKIWREMGVWIEIQTLLIPGKSDSREDIITLCETIYRIDPNLILHFAHYEDDYKFVDHLEHPIRHEKLERTLDPKFEEAYKIAKEIGLQYVYSDHSNTKQYHTTFCPDCKLGLARRGWQGKGQNEEEEEQEGSRRKYERRTFGISFSFEGSLGHCRCGKIVPGYWSNDCIFPLVPAKIDHVPVKFCSREFQDTSGHEVLILFASQTGVSEEYAKSLKKFGQEFFGEKRINIGCLDLINYNEMNLYKEKGIIVIVTSTYFFGRIPRSGRYFYDYLMNTQETKKLKNISYAVIGIGSTGNRRIHLKTYQLVARNIDRKMKELGGRRIMMLEADKKNDFSRTLDEGKKKLWQIIKEELRI